MAQSLPSLLDHVREFLALNYPGLVPAELTVRFLNYDRAFRVPVPPAAPAPAPAPACPVPAPANGQRQQQTHGEEFVPTEFQMDVLAALEGKALRADTLGHKVGDRRRLYRHPGGLRELTERGLVAKHPRLGYYRTDAPPPELAGADGDKADEE